MLDFDGDRLYYLSFEMYSNDFCYIDNKNSLNIIM